MIDPMINLRTIDLGDETVVLDPSRLQFNETTLSDFFENISLWYDYYSSKCAKAESVYANAETAYENKYMEKFLVAKNEGISDKGADASAMAGQVILVWRSESIPKSAVYVYFYP